MIRFPQSRIRLFSLLACTFLASLAVLATPFAATAAVPADPVLEWIGIMNDTTLTAKTNPLYSTRVVALVSASVFDAVNGIDTRFQPLHVKPNAPHNASQRAAAIQAAYVILVHLFPDQKDALGGKRDASLAALGSVEKPNSINAGIAWGQTVADAIWAWRLADGFSPAPPPFVGVLGFLSSPTSIGVWRPTPTGNATGAGPQFASMTPWALLRPSQFRPAPPLDLTSVEYAADVNETKLRGNSKSTVTDDRNTAFFWAGNTPLYWNRIASELSAERNLTLTENAHLFALLNISMGDAGIACWDAKYRYVFWRPITAIRNADVDGNPATDVDPTWTPVLDATTGTPAHPEYPSGHSTVSGAAAFVLAAEFGENTSFSVTSETGPGTRHFANFSDATSQIADARVFAGIHFRTACIRGNLVGRAVAGYVSGHAMRAIGDRDEEEDRD
jgi:PAP2 superfamily protein